MEFNHEKESIAEAMGLSKNHTDELSEKLANIAKQCINDSFKPSHIAEKIANELSYTELVFVATQYLSEKIYSFHQMQEKQIERILSKIVKDIEKYGFDEEE